MARNGVRSTLKEYEYGSAKPIPANYAPRPLTALIALAQDERLTGECDATRCITYLSARDDPEGDESPTRGLSAFFCWLSSYRTPCAVYSSL